MSSVRLLVSGMTVVTLVALIWAPFAQAQSESPSDLAVLAMIPVGSGPREIVVDEGHGRAYVVLSESSSVAVVDTQTLTVVRQWPLHGTVRKMALDPTASRLYVAYDIGNGQTELWSIDAETGAFQQGLRFEWGASGLDVDTRTHRVFMAGVLSSGGISLPRVVALDGDLQAIEQSYPPYERTGVYWGLDVDERNDLLYVSYGSRYCSSDCGVHILGLSSLTFLGRARTGEQPYAVVADIYAVRPIAVVRSGLMLGRIAPIGGTGSLGDLIRLADSPRLDRDAASRPIVADPDAATAYIGPLSGDAPLMVLDLGTLVVSPGPQLTPGSHRLGMDTLSHRIFVTSEADGTISVIQGRLPERS